MSPDNVTPELLDRVLGAGSGDSAEERARASSRRYVRSLDQIAYDSPRATGRRMSAFEALEAYGWNTLVQVEEEGAALLSAGRNAAGQVLQLQREALGLLPKHVASRAGLEPWIVERTELSDVSIPLGWYERVAQSLGMDERFVSVNSVPAADHELTVRLRTIGLQNPNMTSSAVSAIAEASWVATTQLRLERALGVQVIPSVSVQPSANYGAPGYPAFLQGYFLAGKLREQLQLDGTPIASVRELCEESLGIPVIQAELGQWLAGVTVQAGDSRAIVVNIGGENRDVFVRRSTLAHEIGHLLFDPSTRLNSLRVDEFADLARDLGQIVDPVEQRANAFAVELLAPTKAMLAQFYKAGVPSVMDAFGISFTAASHHLRNRSEKSLPSELFSSVRTEPSDHWKAAEAYTSDYHPLRGAPVSRIGRFSAVVCLAAEKNVISWETAAEYLRSDISQVKAADGDIRELFPTVFS